MRATISEHEDFCTELGELHDILTELNGRLEAIDNRCGADFIHININELMAIDCGSAIDNIDKYLGGLNEQENRST